VKEADHLMDATRYGVMTGVDVARIEPLLAKNETWRSRLNGRASNEFGSAQAA
jgi:hypothetical protein